MKTPTEIRIDAQRFEYDIFIVTQEIAKDGDLHFILAEDLKTYVELYN